MNYEITFRERNGFYVADLRKNGLIISKIETPDFDEMIQWTKDTYQEYTKPKAKKEKEYHFDKEAKAKALRDLNKLFQ